MRRKMARTASISLETSCQPPSVDCDGSQLRGQTKRHDRVGVSA